MGNVSRFLHVEMPCGEVESVICIFRRIWGVRAPTDWRPFPFFSLSYLLYRFVVCCCYYYYFFLNDLLPFFFSCLHSFCFVFVDLLTLCSWLLYTVGAVRGTCASLLFFFFPFHMTTQLKALAVSSLFVSFFRETTFHLVSLFLPSIAAVHLGLAVWRFYTRQLRLRSHAFSFFFPLFFFFYSSLIKSDARTYTRLLLFWPPFFPVFFPFPCFAMAFLPQYFFFSSLFIWGRQK